MALNNYWCKKLRLPNVIDWIPPKALIVRTRIVLPIEKGRTRKDELRNFALARVTLLGQAH